MEVDGWAIRRSDEINEPSDVEKSPKLQSLLAKLGNPKPRIDYPYVGFGGVNGVFLLSNLLRARKPQLILKRSVVLTWEDIRDNHLIFVGIGKTQANVRDLLASGDFDWQGMTIRNLKPRPGEATEYRETLAASGERVECVFRAMPISVPN